MSLGKLIYRRSSADILEHYFEFMLGGAGTFGMRSANLVEKAAKKEDIKLNEIPFYRRIKGEPDSRESMADFFERSDKIGQKIRQRDLLRGRERINYVKSKQIVHKHEQRSKEGRVKVKGD